MFENSKDILYIVLAVSILGVSTFLCVVLFYVVRILKNTSAVVDELAEKVQYLASIVDAIKEKVDQVSGIMSLGVGGMVKKFIGKKAEAMVDEGSDRASDAAKQAVDRAVEATAEKMRKATRKIKR